MAAWIEEKPESKWQNPKTTLETKSETHKTSIYDETEKHMLKNGKSVREKPKFHGIKTDPKKNIENPNAPLMDESVNSVQNSYKW